MALQRDSKIQRDNVLVAVRVRSHEAHKSIIDISGSNLVLHPPRSASAGAKAHQFGFDRCYANYGGNTGSQEDVFNDLGQIALQNVFSGFNVTILAYGQTGSGKSYCMMGPASDPGLIPRISKELFRRINEQSSNVEGLKYTCEASYYEIYNEKVRDLLDPKKMDSVGLAGLTVREHPKHGPYVEDLSNIPVQSYEDVANLLSQGNSGRTVAATRMNAESSRSHAIFTLKLKQTVKNPSEGVICEKVAHIHLVDLAGSERHAKTRAQGINLKEAAEINKSLVTLGRVISSLAESNSGKKIGSPSRNTSHIPFRDSTLTWLLKRSFGIDGNSRTMLLCTVSSKESDYEESLGSLRYAARAKQIVTSAVCNEDSNNNLVEGLKNEIKELTAKLGSAEKSSSQEIQQLTEQLENAQKLIQIMNMSWEDKLKKAEQIRVERENALEREGIAIKLDPYSPFLCSLREDPGAGDCLVYYLKKGDTNVGRSPALSQPSILLHLDEGPDLFCTIKTMNDCTSILIPHDGVSQIFVNGQQVSQDVVLSHSDRVIFGSKLAFRYSASMNYLQKNPPENRTEINWDFAHKELKARLDSVLYDLEKERDQVKLLEMGAAENDAKFHNLIKQLEVERANKAELSEKLKLAIEETVKARRLLEVSENGFETITRTHRQQLSKMKEELKREKSLRGNLANIVDRIRNDGNAPEQALHSPLDTGISLSLRARVEAIAKAWRVSVLNTSSRYLDTIMIRIYSCNSMAYALGHEVLFQLIPNVKLANNSPIPLLEGSPIVCMKSITVPAVCFSSDDFINFYLKLREFYCHTLERLENRKETLQLDPIDYLKANPLQISDVAWGVVFSLSSIDSSSLDEPVVISLFSGLGHRIGRLLLKIYKMETDNAGPLEVVFELIGIHFLQSDISISHPISVCIICPGPEQEKRNTVEFNDVPVVQSTEGEFNEERILRNWVVNDLGDLDKSLQVQVKMGTLYPSNLNGDHEIWNNARQRYQSLKKVSALKTPLIGLDGSIRLPGPSPRLVSARAAIPQESAQEGSISGIAIYSKSDVVSSISAVPVERDSPGTRIHVAIEIQELTPSSGVYNNCWTRRTEDDNILFKVSLSKPKRFQIRILQADMKHFALESCLSLKVTAIRSAGLKDGTVFDCDITQEQIHIHDRYLIFRCPWPSELANHSYAQRNSTFELDIEMSLYVDWQPEPVSFKHTLHCKAFSRVGFFKNFVNNITLPKRHSGFFCSLKPVADPKLVSDFKSSVKTIRRKLSAKLALEKHRFRRSSGEYSRSDEFFKAALDIIHHHSDDHFTISSSPTVLKVTVSKCSEADSVPERSGFLHQNHRRLFCVLRYPFLQLFKNVSQSVEVDCISLPGGSVYVDDSQQPFAFRLQCKSKTYCMQASCEEDLQQWIRCLSMYLNTSA